MIFKSFIIIIHDKIIILIQHAKVIILIQRLSSFSLETELITQHLSSMKSNYMKSFNENELKLEVTLVSKYAIALKLSLRQYDIIIKNTLNCV